MSSRLEGQRKFWSTEASKALTPELVRQIAELTCLSGGCIDDAIRECKKVCVLKGIDW